jgi:dipeptidyl aminopeptidase/acylaminoacyl peptidase
MLFGRDGSLYQVSAGGGAPRLVARPSASGPGAYRFPQFLPHSRRFLYFEYSTRDAAQSAIYTASLDSPLKTRVVNADYQARFVDAGYLFLIRNGDLLAQPVDARSFALTGEPIVVAEQVQVDPNLNFRTAAFSVSSAGSFVYGTGSQPKTRLVWFDRRGNQGRTLGTPDAGYAAELSPDGSQVALELMDPEGRGHLWVMDVERGTKRALARTAGVWEYGPHWSPDGRFLAYAATSVRLTASLRRRPADGSGVEDVLAPESPLLKFVDHWSVDGRFVLFSTANGLSMLSLADRRVSPVPQTRAGESLERLSPDGQWLAYVSNESDRDEVYVRPLAGGQKVLVSTEGGSSPYWRRDGRELYYVGQGNSMMAVSVSATGQLKVGAPQLLFRLPRTAAGRSPYSTIDGERFLVRTSESDAASSLTWVLNWPALQKNP